MSEEKLEGNVFEKRESKKEELNVLEDIEEKDELTREEEEDWVFTSLGQKPSASILFSIENP